MPKNALTITDQRTDKTYEAPIEHGTIRAMDLRKIKTDPEDFGLMTYDPAFMNTASCKSSITFIDGDKGILRYRGYDIETLAEHCTYPAGGLPAALRRAADARAGQGLDLGDHPPHHAARDHQALHRWLPLRRPSDGNPGEHAGGALDRVSRGEERPRSGEPAEADRAPDRQDGDPGGLFLSPSPRSSLRLSRQRSQLHRELHEHAVEDDRAEVRRPARSSPARWMCCSSCTPTTSRTAARPPCAWWAARRPIRISRWRERRRRSPARCTAAPTKKCCACSTRSAR